MIEIELMAKEQSLVSVNLQNPWCQSQQLSAKADRQMYASDNAS